MEYLRSAFIGFLQILTSEVVSVILVVGVPAAMTVLRKKYPTAGVTVGYALGFMAIGLMIVASSTVILERAERPETTSIDNIEERIYAWCRSVNYACRESTPKNPGVRFAIDVTPNQSGPVTVSVGNDFEAYLVVSTALRAGESTESVFSRLTEDQAKALLLDLKIQLLQSGVEFTIEGDSNRLSRLVLLAHVPITPELTAHDFLFAIRDVTSARMLSIVAMERRLLGDRAALSDSANVDDSQ